MNIREETEGEPYHACRLIGDISQCDETVVSNADTLRRPYLLFEDAQGVELEEDAFDHFVARGDDRKEFGDGQQKLIVFSRVEDVQKTLKAVLAALNEQFRVVIVDGHFQ